MIDWLPIYCCRKSRLSWCDSTGKPSRPWGTVVVSRNTCSYPWSQRISNNRDKVPERRSIVSLTHNKIIPRAYIEGGRRAQQGPREVDATIVCRLFLNILDIVENRPDCSRQDPPSARIRIVPLTDFPLSGVNPMRYLCGVAPSNALTTQTCLPFQEAIRTCKSTYTLSVGQHTQLHFTPLSK